MKSNAQWQRWLVAAHAAAIAGWMAWTWRTSPWLALAGLILVPLASRALMLPQFLVMAWVRRRAGDAPIGAPALLRAWWVESRWAALVFGGWQPFRQHAEPDWLPPAPLAGAAPAPRGVVLVHGYLCNRGFWLAWLRLLRARGHACVALTLEPPFCSIDDYAGAIDAAVRRVAEATGRAPLVVGHSMGGLALRAWLRAVPGADARVHRVATLGTPHHGTWAARHAGSVNGRQMALDSDWLQALAQAEPPARRALFVCWQAVCDNVVYPARAAVLHGADHRCVDGVAHVALAFHPQVLRECLALLDLPDPGDAADAGHAPQAIPAAPAVPASPPGAL